MSPKWWTCSAATGAAGAGRERKADVLGGGAQTLGVILEHGRALVGGVEVADDRVEAVAAARVEPAKAGGRVRAADILQPPHAARPRQRVGIGEQRLDVLDLDQQRMAGGSDGIAQAEQ